MTVLGIFAMLLGLIGLRIAFSEWTRLRLAIFFILYVMHLAATVAYYLFADQTRTDAFAYYHDLSGYYYEVGFGLSSTQLVFSLLHHGRATLGGTFLDWSLLFGFISFIGICVLCRTIEDIFKELEIEPPLFAYLPLFLPGLHFWTSGIGKDGPLLLGACLAIWSSMDLKARWKYMGAALLVMMLFRPHIGLTASIVFGAILFFNRRIRLAVRVPLLAGAVLMLGYAAANTEATLGVDLGSAESVTRFLIRQGEVTQQTDVAGNSAVFGSFPFKLFSLLFRPLFFDADTAMYWLASLENAALVLLVGAIVFRIRDTIVLFRKVIYVRFAVLFGSAACLALALVYYNIGLGLRQKTMFVPSIIIVYVSIMAVRQARWRWRGPPSSVYTELPNGPSAARAA